MDAHVFIDVEGNGYVPNCVQQVHDNVEVWQESIMVVGRFLCM